MKTFLRLRRNRILRWAGATLVVALALLFSVFARPTHAENERVLTIYHDDVQQTIVTDAQTVGDALKRANVAIGPKDAVEPAGSTKLTASGYDVNVYRARPVTVVDGSQRYQIMSPHTSARQIAVDAGLTLYPEDGYQFSRIDNFLAEDSVGIKLIINRATPVNFMLYGNLTPIRTQSKTVGDLLKEKGVHLTADDGTNVPLSTALTPNIQVEVWRNGVQTTTEEQPVSFTTDYIRDADKPTSYHQVQTPGVNGKKVVTYQVTLKNGQVTDRKEIQSVVTVQPTKQVEVIGVMSGSFADALSKLRACESGGNYANKKNPNFRGAYQFGYTTWANYGGYYDPADAPPNVQDAAATALYQRRGWAPWSCASIVGLQDIYR
ncbi:MAG TPA: ubiquitin-like domain-containing protein [Candidatus Saccharimonas sp.]|nr:ubiquitin-like domain-containing protein [Candidatus Saccharimonas sp.]